MKKYTLFTAILVVFATVSVFAQNSAKSNAPFANSKRNVSGATVGSLIVQDSDGNIKLSTGDEFEKILGFTTNAPYVTPNKPKSPTDKRDEFTAIGYGSISTGDYVCPCSESPGSVKKCDAGQKPYAKALSSAGTGSRFTVKVLPEYIR